jgi:Flp pilus assembly protein TadG
MAIVLPVLLLLVFGIIEVSNAWRTHQVITNIVREGAREAIVGGTPVPTEGAIRTSILNKMTAQGLGAPDTIIIECDGAAGMCSGTGQETAVALEYPYTFSLLGPIVNWACGNSCGAGFGTIMIGSRTVMRKE